VLGDELHDPVVHPEFASISAVLFAAGERRVVQTSGHAGGAVLIEDSCVFHGLACPNKPDVDLLLVPRSSERPGPIEGDPDLGIVVARSAREEKLRLVEPFCR
jgi:hypothetical protein